jgi:hypothetical protein
LVDTETPALELVAVKLLDGLCGIRLFAEFDEGESSRTPSNAVGWHEYPDHLTHLGEKGFEFTLRRIVAQVPDEHLGANGDLLSSRLFVATHVRGV